MEGAGSEDEEGEGEGAGADEVVEEDKPRVLEEQQTIIIHEDD